MFEATHGSAPDIAGKGMANPSGLINAAVMMLSHLGQTAEADKIKNAWLTTIEEGYHTADIYTKGLSYKRVSTAEFTELVIENMDRVPTKLPKSKLSEGGGQRHIPSYVRKEEDQQLVGVTPVQNVF